MVSSLQSRHGGCSRCRRTAPEQQAEVDGTLTILSFSILTAVLKYESQVVTAQTLPCRERPQPVNSLTLEGARQLKLKRGK